MSAMRGFGIAAITVLMLALGAGEGQAGNKRRPAPGTKPAAGTRPAPGTRPALGTKPAPGTKPTPGTMAAPTKPGKRIMAKMCKPDAQKLCKDVVPGDKRIAMCLAEHETELSAGCLQAIKRLRRVNATRTDCAADITSLCKDVQAGGGKILACLKQNVASVSPACQARFAKADQPAEVADVAGVLDETVTEPAPAPADAVDQTVPIAEEIPVAN